MDICVEILGRQCGSSWFIRVAIFSCLFVCSVLLDHQSTMSSPIAIVRSPICSNPHLLTLRLVSRWALQLSCPAEAMRMKISTISPLSISSSITAKLTRKFPPHALTSAGEHPRIHEVAPCSTFVASKGVQLVRLLPTPAHS